MERLETIWPLDPSLAPSSCQEIVVLTSSRVETRYEAEVVRTWVSDLEGSGLEGDVTDPVEVLSEEATSELAGFHARAITELLRRLASDYEVADLFCDDQALGLGQESYQ